MVSRVRHRFRTAGIERSLRSSEKFLSFYKEIIVAQYFLFHIILSNYLWSILFYQNKDRNVRQIRFHVCIKMHRCKRRVCKRKTLFRQPNVIPSERRRSLDRG